MKNRCQSFDDDVKLMVLISHIHFYVKYRISATMHLVLLSFPLLFFFPGLKGLQH